MNTVAPWPSVLEAEARVLHVQTKFHKWAATDQTQQFHDLFNLVGDRATLVVAWQRIRTNRGSRTAGVDGITRRDVEQRVGVERFLDGIRLSLKDGSYRPQPVRERMIPKAGGKLRRLGIATLRDRVVQMALKLVLEPIFEPDQYRSSYAYRPGRRAQDAVAEIVHLVNNGYEWVVEGDVEACFDSIEHRLVVKQLRTRLTDHRVLGLCKAFLKAGVLTELGRLQRTVTGTPQGALSAHCLLTWRCTPLSTSTLPRCGRRSRGIATSAPTCAPRGRPPIDSSAMRTYVELNISPWGYPFNRSNRDRQFSTGGSLEGAPSSGDARAPGVAQAVLPGAAGWR
ncbi:MAG: reverse transcriptase domain-containing protein [Thermoleophilia bacterium]|nr:reverse transcriptase domain-containing protein [Thermoleophilia bacterium]